MATCDSNPLGKYYHYPFLKSWVSTKKLGEVKWQAKVLKATEVAEEGLTPRPTPKAKFWLQDLLLLWLVHEFYSQPGWKVGFFLYACL